MVALLASSIAWQAASRPTLRRSSGEGLLMLLDGYTVSGERAILERMTKLRGALSQIQGGFECAERAPFDDGWTPEDAPQPELKTQVTLERARSIISRN